MDAKTRKRQRGALVLRKGSVFEANYKVKAYPSSDLYYHFDPYLPRTSCVSILLLSIYIYSFQIEHHGRTTNH